MKQLSLFLSIHNGLHRSEVMTSLPNATEVHFRNAEGDAVCDAASLMCLPDSVASDRPHVLVAEFDRNGFVDFVELRRSFSEVRAAKAWGRRLEDILIERGVVVDDNALEQPVERTTAHDGKLIFWRSWLVDDVSVLSMTIRRLPPGDSSHRAVATLSTAIGPWRDSFGPSANNASWPHRADEWDGWDTTADSALEQPSIEDMLISVREVISDVEQSSSDRTSNISEAGALSER